MPPHERLLEPADEVERRAADEDVGAGRRPAAERIDVQKRLGRMDRPIADVAARDDLVATPGPARPIVRAAEQRADLRHPVEQLDLLAKLGGSPPVIAIDECDELAPRAADAEVAARARPAIGVARMFEIAQPLRQAPSETLRDLRTRIT
jgi:hypothetical protein